jgi:hypothetical protein
MVCLNELLCTQHDRINTGDTENHTDCEQSKDLFSLRSMTAHKDQGHCTTQDISTHPNAV